MELESKKFASGIQLKQVEEFLLQQFKKYYRFITMNEFLTIKQFISLSINHQAQEMFKTIMYELQTLLELMKVKLMKPVPLSVDSMVNFMGYLTQKNKLLRKFNRIKEQDEVHAFYLLEELNTLDPSIHNLEKLQNRQEAQKIRREQLKLIQMVGDKYQSSTNKQSFPVIYREQNKKLDIQFIDRQKTNSIDFNDPIHHDGDSDSGMADGTKSMINNYNYNYRGKKKHKGNTFNPVTFKMNFLDNMKRQNHSLENSLNERTEDLQLMISETKKLRESLNLPGEMRKFKQKSKLRDYQTNQIDFKSLREDLKKFQFVKEYKMKYKTPSIDKINKVRPFKFVRSMSMSHKNTPTSPMACTEPQNQPLVQSQVFSNRKKINQKKFQPQFTIDELQNEDQLEKTIESNESAQYIPPQNTENIKSNKNKTVGKRQYTNVVSNMKNNLDFDEKNSSKNSHHETSGILLEENMKKTLFSEAKNIFSLPANKRDKLDANIKKLITNSKEKWGLRKKRPFNIFKDNALAHSKSAQNIKPTSIFNRSDSITFNKVRPRAKVPFKINRSVNSTQKGFKESLSQNKDMGTDLIPSFSQNYQREYLDLRKSEKRLSKKRKEILGVFFQVSRKNGPFRLTKNKIMTSQKAQRSYTKLKPVYWRETNPYFSDVMDSIPPKSSKKLFKDILHSSTTANHHLSGKIELQSKEKLAQSLDPEAKPDPSKILNKVSTMLRRKRVRNQRRQKFSLARNAPGTIPKFSEGSKARIVKGRTFVPMGASN